MPEKATLEIQIKDAGGSLGDYGGPIDRGDATSANNQGIVSASKMSSGSKTGDQTQEKSGQETFLWQDVPGLEKLVEAANSLGRELPEKINNGINSLLEKIANENREIRDDPLAQKAVQQRIQELQGRINRVENKAQEVRYQEIFGRGSDKEQKRQENAEPKEDREQSEYLKLLKQQNEQLTGLLRNTTSLTRQFGGLAGTIAALDVRGFSRQLTLATSQIPYVGEYLGLLTMALTGAIDGINDTADRLARFSPDLAVTQANIRVGRILRDLNFAQQLGPQLANFQQRQEDVRIRAEDLLIEILPKVLPIAERSLDYAETIVAGLEKITALVEIIADFLDGFNINLFGQNYTGSQVAGMFASPVIGILELLTTIRENTEPSQTTQRTNRDFIEELLQGVQLPANPAVVGVQNAPANIPGAQGQVPFRLPNPIP